MIKRLLWIPFLGTFLCCHQQDVAPEKDQPAMRAEKLMPAQSKQHINANQEVLPQVFTTREIVEKKEGCKYKDGIYTAAVKYHNPDTDHTATYDLQIHIARCAVIRIDFPNGGWLDEDHIPATALDKNGGAKFNDDKGRKWEVLVNTTQ